MSRSSDFHSLCECKYSVKNCCWYQVKSVCHSIMVFLKWLLETGQFNHNVTDCKILKLVISDK